MMTRSEDEVREMIIKHNDLLNKLDESKDIHPKDKQEVRIILLNKIVVLKWFIFERVHV